MNPDKKDFSNEQHIIRSWQKEKPYDEPEDKDIADISRVINVRGTIGGSKIA